MKHFFITDTIAVGKARIETIATDLKLHKKKGNTEFKKILERKDKYIKGVNSNG